MPLDSDNWTCERPACQWVNNSTRSSIKIFLLAISALPSASRRMQSEPVCEAHTGQTHPPGWELRDSQGGEFRDGQPLKPGKYVTADSPITATNGNPRDVVRQMLDVVTRFYLPDNLLEGATGCPWRHITFLRPPFLDHHLVEFAFSLPSNYRVMQGRTKWIVE
jgi:hypothetical protein